MRVYGAYLQVTFATLVANRAVQRVVDQEEFHDTLAGDFTFCALGEHVHASHYGDGARCLRLENETKHTMAPD